MNPKFYIAGHHGFHNRGCEALVRSIVQLVRAEFPGATFIVPSACLDFDRLQWPDAADSGVELVDFYAFPESIRWWNRAYRLMPQLAPGFAPPMPDLPPVAARLLDRCDAVIMTGGDVISLDYSAASLLRWLAQGQAAVRRGKPIVLWSSSVGPFTANAGLERLVVKHLAQYTLLSTRESRSQAYLQGLGLPAVLAAVDPAFVLAKQQPGQESLLPAPGPAGVLGFNISPLIAQARAKAGTAAQLESDVLAFLRDVPGRYGLHIALIPHVDPARPGDFAGDWAYMEGLRNKLGLPDAQVKLLPPNLNAGQLKWALAQCTCFIGARTHATIGAISSGVPTLSIAYSVKARGINEDLFGDTRYMLDTPKVDAQSLHAGLALLLADRQRIQTMLAERLPEWRRRAALPATALRRVLQGVGSPVA